MCVVQVSDLVLCGRRLSAAEALARGLVARVLWQPGFTDQLRAWARHLAAQPLQVTITRLHCTN